jgi:OTU domain-containing protein 6
VSDDATAVVDPAEAKREKARLKKLKKKEKEAADEKAVAEAMANAGPTNRALENDAIVRNNKFGESGRKIVDVKADGHCLYRSVGAVVGKEFSEVRSLAADVLAAHPDDYAPFAMDDEGTPFDQYCNSVRSSATWGGELELRAIARGLRRDIVVFNASATPILVEAEEKGGGNAIELSYHRSYYELGEHYNCVERA